MVCCLLVMELLRVFFFFSSCVSVLSAVEFTRYCIWARQMCSLLCKVKRDKKDTNSFHAPAFCVCVCVLSLLFDPQCCKAEK
jgi:hypothetical protein